MNIITGYMGEAHITAQEDRDINLGIVGKSTTELYVLDVGQQLEAEIVSANEVRVKDGVLVMQGCAASIDYGTYDSLTISNGSQGMQRIDVIAAQYERDGDTNVETVSLVVIEGTPAASDPNVPSLTGGSIQGGDSLVQMPLYYVNIDGVSIDSVDAQFVQISGLSDYVEKRIIETGTEDLWTYRKWSDGTAECWGRKTGSANITTSWGSMYFASAFTVNLPTGLFVSKPVIEMLNHSSTSALVMGGGSISSASFNVQLVRGTSASNAAYDLGFFVVGKWK